MENTTIVLNCLKEKNEPMKAGDIAAATGLEKKSVDAAIKLLKAEGQIESPKRCYYAACAE